MILTVRKAMLALVLTAVVAGVAGGSAVWAATQTFSDVPAGHPFVDEIEWAAAQGIVAGYPDGTFKPANVVTRQAAVAFLSRYNSSIELVRGPEVSTTTTMVSSYAVCPVGKRAISGGGYAFTGNWALTDSYPASSINAPAATTAGAVRWNVTWQTTTGGSELFAGQVYAICAPVPAP